MQGEVDVFFKQVRTVDLLWGTSLLVFQNPYEHLNLIHSIILTVTKDQEGSGEIRAVRAHKEDRGQAPSMPFRSRAREIQCPRGVRNSDGRISSFFLPGGMALPPSEKLLWTFQVEPIRVRCVLTLELLFHAAPAVDLDIETISLMPQTNPNSTLRFEDML